MRVIIAGGHGKIALLLERLLAERGDTAVGLIRTPSQAKDLEAAGAEARVVDLEEATVEQVAEPLREADAVVFAAGAGSGSGAERKKTVDRDGAILLADAAERAGVERYLMISAIDADPQATHEEPVFEAYLRAKGEADEDVRARDALDATIVRPGRLTDDPGTGNVKIADETGGGSVPREDVAAVLAALLDAPATGGQTFELIAGETPISDAVAARAQ